MGRRVAYGSPCVGFCGVIHGVEAAMILCRPVLTGANKKILKNFSVS